VIRVPAPLLAPSTALALCLRGERGFLLRGAFAFAGCDPDDGLSWRPGDAGDPFALLEAAQRRWSGGPVDDKPWPTAVGFLDGELDFARYPAIWRLDTAAERAEVLATDAASAQRLLERLHRKPPPVELSETRAFLQLAPERTLISSSEEIVISGRADAALLREKLNGRAAIGWLGPAGRVELSALSR
jgi:hypothetical protein